jgi:N-acylneuraminate cytidylyltransferase
MSRDRVTWGLILARAGSKAIPRKNLVEVGGLPLVLRAVRQAVRIADIARVVVSTDDPEIARLVRSPGVEIVQRRAQDATDDARSAIAAIHALEVVGAQADDVAVLLQPTSPLRSDDDIRRTIAGLRGGGCCVTVCEARHHPFKSLVEQNGELAPPRGWADLEQPRQDLPPAFVLNGAVYVLRVSDLVANRSFFCLPIRTVVMPEHRSLDIDGPWDLASAEALLSGPTALGELRGG